MMLCGITDRVHRMWQRYNSLAGRRPLGVDVNGVEGLARGHEEAVPLRPAEGDVRAGFGQANAPEQRAGRVPDRDATVADAAPRIARAPQVAVDIGPDAVRAARDAIHGELREFLDVADSPIVGDVPHMHVAAADDVEPRVVG